MIDRSLRVAGLFAGIGGIEEGLHRAGHRTSALCENDPGAIAVLEERFPGVPIHRDVRTLLDVGDADLLTAGFPCQDLSQAGGTKGMNGDQSSLVSHVFRLLGTRRTPWVLLENVPFMLRLNKGSALDFVIAALERLGYHWAYRVIDTRAFGLPHRRERVFIVASTEGDPRTILFNGNFQPVHEGDPTGAACGFYWTEGTRGLGWAVNAVPTLKGGSTIGIPSPPAILFPDGRLVKPDIRDAERLQGFPADWTAPAEKVGKKSHRWKLVGNAVTVDVAEWIGSRFAASSDVPEVQAYPLPGRSSWPRAAWNVGEGRYAAELSTQPVRKQGLPLAEFLLFPPTPLSVRATAGFLSRARASSLRFGPGFLDAVENHLVRMEAMDALQGVASR